MEFSRQKYWNGWPFPSPRGLPHPGIEPGSPALQADSLLSEPPGKPSVSNRGNIKLFFLCQRHWVNIFEASKQILNLTREVPIHYFWSLGVGEGGPEGKTKQEGHSSIRMLNSHLKSFSRGRFLGAAPEILIEQVCCKA